MSLTCEHGILTHCSQCAAAGEAAIKAMPPFKTLGDVVQEHVAEMGGNHSTQDGVRLLGLEGVEPAEIRYGAANLYLAALSIIRKLNGKDLVR